MPMGLRPALLKVLSPSVPQFPHLVYVVEHKQLTSGYTEKTTPTSGNSPL